MTKFLKYRYVMVGLRSPNVHSVKATVDWSICLISALISI